MKNSIGIIISLLVFQVFSIFFYTGEELYIAAFIYSFSKNYFNFKIISRCLFILPSKQISRIAEANRTVLKLNPLLHIGHNSVRVAKILILQ